MHTADFLDRLLYRYSYYYDIVKPYESSLAECTAYGRFESRNEKYVLTRKANIWTVLEFEHVFFLEVDKLTQNLLDEIRSAVTEELEPRFVRCGEKYPPKDHMCTFLSFVIICNKKPDSDAAAALKKFRQRRGYLLGFRGRFETRLICADVEAEGVIMNFRDRALKKLYAAVFDDVRNGRFGIAAAGCSRPGCAGHA